MMFTMVVALYTSRIILKILGIEDFGVYQTVGGIVGFLSFINVALSTGSSRFLTYELGSGDKEKLRRTFSTTLTIHILLALFIGILAESVGVWFIHNKLLIDASRINAAVFVFHISILTSIFSLTQVPYNASIIAHERMSVYAFISIFEVSAKLGILYLLNIGDFDKLKLYAVLLCIVQISVMLIERIYCIRNFNETRYRFIFDRSIFKSIASFSGWSLFGSGAIALHNQGSLLLLGMFFSPAVVAARAISLQVNMAANQFVGNFRIAVNPQIVKQYAVKNYDGSKQLLLTSTKYSYYLMLMISFPIVLLAKPILELWLTEVPKYTDIFLQIIVIQSLFDVFNVSFYTALYAKGQLRENALISPVIIFLVFPIAYFFFKAGYSPVVLAWASLIAYTVLGLIAKPILIIKIVSYNRKDIFSVFIPCLWVSLASIPIPVLCYYYINSNIFIGFVAVAVITVISVATSVYFIGFDKKTQKIVIREIKKVASRFKILKIFLKT